MGYNNLFDSKMHCQELNQKVKKLASQSYIGDAHLQKLSDLLIDDIEKLSINLYSLILDNIKANKLVQLPSSIKVINFIKDKIELIFAEYQIIIQNEASRVFKYNTPSRNAAVANLAFRKRFDQKVNNLCISIEAKHTEFCTQKINEQTQLFIEKATLNKAHEANRIAKSNRAGVWFTGFVAFCALIVSVIALIKQH